ncbi:hypothetical protein BDU57DRAFT_523909 [Ampelomyces quisqualis]|uniref:HIT-type domain-containing protein n=1 Tax=Ampelomyces quisqualis TaxID=50730 RepID=A0A6A5Q8V3_AMPQU|nr:hypothetical protein BDU57DRAFT_523909 [Ampelomyces quisqualis]
MPGEGLLSDLCSICNTTASKYCCPGCSARTCSLPCYKRHQQWAQCSGRRDPTKFVKKSQLVTPAGIDHDFNFLTGIERDIEKAEKGLQEGGDRTSTSAQSWSQAQSTRKGQTNYEHLESASVKVIRAPRGLSRQKENKSHRSNNKRASSARIIIWTVEWFDDRKMRLLTETSSTCPVETAQPFVSRDSHKVKKRKRHVDSYTTASFATKDVRPIAKDQGMPSQCDLNIEVVEKEPKLSTSGRRASHPEEEKAEKAKAELAEADTTDYCDNGSSTKPMGHVDCGFYLVKPRTNSSKIVLIPLIPTATIGECLNGRTVLEFPTIYVLPKSTPQLPQEFMLEEDYLKQEGEERKEFDALISELDPEILQRLKADGQQPGPQTTYQEEVDSKEILDVLKKDFGAIV